VLLIFGGLCPIFYYIHKNPRRQTIWNTKKILTWLRKFLLKL
jgi:hypothetical protein